MLTMSVSVLEMIVRAALVYFFLLIALRLSGKREIGQLSPFDFILLLVLSNAVQNSMSAGDNSLIGGLISAATLVILNFILSWATFRSKRLSKLVEGSPSILVHNGIINESMMARERLTHHDLDVALRKTGCPSLHEVHFAILEVNGSISVVKKSDLKK